MSAPARAYLPFPPYGVLQLDAAGRSITSVPLPGDPCLRGQSMYMQSIFGTPLGLSDLEIVTLHGI